MQGAFFLSCAAQRLKGEAWRRRSFRQGRAAPAGPGLDGAGVLDAHPCAARRLDALQRMEAAGLGFAFGEPPWGRMGTAAATGGNEQRSASRPALTTWAGGGSFATFARSAWLNACGDGAAVAALTGCASGAGAAGTARHRAGAPDITVHYANPQGARSAVASKRTLFAQRQQLCVMRGYVESLAIYPGAAARPRPARCRPGPVSFPSREAPGRKCQSPRHGA